MNKDDIAIAYSVPPLQHADLGQGVISWRESGRGSCVVLLHGISSGASIWAKQFNDPQLNTHFRLLAWDAPGYGVSDDLAKQHADATEYARALDSWLTALKINRCVLLGHSLGALIAAAYAAHYPARIRGMILADPAQGYANADQEKRQQVFLSRQQQSTQLSNLAWIEQRAGNLLRSEPHSMDLQQVKYAMSRLRPTGFRAAAWMLANDDIHRYLNQCDTTMQVWCGAVDTITPPDKAEQLAQQYQAKFRLLPAAGHASYLDASQAFNHFLSEFMLDLLQE